MKKSKWLPGPIQIKKHQVTDERFEQLLAEVGELLYVHLCQHIQKSSTEPSVKKLGFTQTEVSLNEK